MTVEPAVLALLRDTLEREIPGASVSVFFQALAAHGPRVPSTFNEIVAFVEGPLRRSLVERYAERRAKEIVAALEYALRVAELPTQELSRVRARNFDEETTKTVLSPSGPLSVAVLCAGGVLADRCAACFRRDEMTFVTVRAAGDLARLPPGLDVALVDASDLPRASPRAIASSLASVPLVLVWGNDADAAKQLVAALDREGVRTMGFALEQSVDPMIDVLRARIG